jgi:predicted PurR-regulated permease PerM
MIITSVSIIKKLLIAFLVFAGLYYGKGFFIPLTIGAVLATLFLPFCKWLEGKKIPKGVAVLICLLVLLLASAIIIAMLGWQISALTADLTLLKQKIVEIGEHTQAYIVSHFGISTERQVQLFINGQSSFTQSIPKMAGSLASIFTNAVLVLVYICFILYYRNHIKDFFLKLSKSNQQNEMKQVVYDATRISQQYLVGLTKMIVCLWIMYGIGFSIIGVKNALFFAFLCGLLEIVPFIGNLTGTTLTILVAAMQGGSLPMLVTIAGTYALIQFIQGWILEPLILGPQVKINPLFTIIALVIGELVWGIPGIFLAIPLTAMFKIVCDHIEPLKPYGFLIGEVESKTNEFGFIKKLKNWYKRKLHK